MGSVDRGFGSRASRFPATRTIRGRASRRCTTSAMTSPSRSTGRGRHDFKVGGEYLYYHELTQNRRNANMVIDAAGVPPPANLPAILPDWENADTWNLNALNPTDTAHHHWCRRLQRRLQPEPSLRLWVQDDWKVERLA